MLPPRPIAVPAGSQGLSALDDVIGTSLNRGRALDTVTRGCWACPSSRAATTIIRSYSTLDTLGLNVFCLDVAPLRPFLRRQDDTRFMWFFNACHIHYTRTFLKATGWPERPKRRAPSGEFRTGAHCSSSRIDSMSTESPQSRSTRDRAVFRRKIAQRQRDGTPEDRSGADEKRSPRDHIPNPASSSDRIRRRPRKRMTPAAFLNPFTTRASGDTSSPISRFRRHSGQAARLPPTSAGIGTPTPEPRCSGFRSYSKRVGDFTTLRRLESEKGLSATRPAQRAGQ